jgi:hypothetical protein
MAPSTAFLKNFILILSSVGFSGNIKLTAFPQKVKSVFPSRIDFPAGKRASGLKNVVPACMFLPLLVQFQEMRQ